MEAASEGEWIAGVPRSILFDNKYWTGFEQADEKEMFELISQHLDFKPRTEKLEKNEKFKQVIPYFLVKKGRRYFTSVRKTKGGDSRVHGFRLIGFGGHLRQEDIEGKMTTWLKREFKEEINAEKILAISFKGIVNDDSNAVGGIGKVHFGLVFVVEVGGRVAIKENDKFEQGEFMAVAKLKARAHEMESWSKLVVAYL